MIDSLSAIKPVLTATGFKRQKITVLIGQKGKKKCNKTVEVEAFIKDGMAVHRAIGSESTWTVTHIKSCRAIKTFYNIKHAKKFISGFKYLEIPLPSEVSEIDLTGKWSKEDQRKARFLIDNLRSLAETGGLIE